MHVNGVVSVVRVAKALFELGFHPVLSTLEVDARWKIDLMVRFGERDAKLACHQIKTNRKRHSPLVQAIWLSESPPPPQSRITHGGEVAHGIHVLKQRERLSMADIIGAIMYTGGEESLPWECQNTRPLAEALANVLREHL